MKPDVSMYMRLNILQNIYHIYLYACMHVLICVRVCVRDRVVVACKARKQK